MKKIKIFYFIFIFISFPLLAETIKSKEHLIEVLEKDGIKPGMTIWLKRPLAIHSQPNRIPGLSRLTFIDADVLPKFDLLPESKKQLVIFTKNIQGDDIKLVLEDSDIYFNPKPPLFSTAELLLYKEDPSRKTKKWGKKVLDAISQKSFFIGMTEEQVQTSTGYPDRINESSGEWGIHEQWIYGEYPNTSYLYFKNGILRSVQQSR